MAPFALFVEPQLRLKQWQVEGGNKLRKKITTHTQGFAKPLIFLAAPMNMTQGRNSSDPLLMGMYCPRNLCQTPAEIVYAGVVLEHLQGGNIPEIEAVFQQSPAQARALCEDALKRLYKVGEAADASWGGEFSDLIPSTTELLKRCLQADPPAAAWLKS